MFEDEFKNSRSLENPQLLGEMDTRGGLLESKAVRRVPGVPWGASGAP